jgi:hypothetical protein
MKIATNMNAAKSIRISKIIKDKLFSSNSEEDNNNGFSLLDLAKKLAKRKNDLDAE